VLYQHKAHPRISKTFIRQRMLIETRIGPNLPIIRQVSGDSNSSIQSGSSLLKLSQAFPGAGSFTSPSEVTPILHSFMDQTSIVVSLLPKRIA
jgi:hypothetical protein